MGFAPAGRRESDRKSSCSVLTLNLGTVPSCLCGCPGRSGTRRPSAVLPPCCPSAGCRWPFPMPRNARNLKARMPIQRPLARQFCVGSKGNLIVKERLGSGQLSFLLQTGLPCSKQHPRRFACLEQAHPGTTSEGKSRPTRTVQATCTLCLPWRGATLPGRREGGFAASRLRALAESRRLSLATIRCRQDFTPLEAMLR